MNKKILIVIAVVALGVGAAFTLKPQFEETAAQKEFRLFQEKCKTNPELQECKDDALLRKQ